MDFEEKTLEKNVVFSGRVIQVRRDKVELVDGRSAWREVVDHSGGVCILPLDSDCNVHCVRQFRYAYMSELLEVPAGRIEVGESPECCAERELSEETGLTASSITHLTTMYPTPGYCNERLHIYLATGLTQGKAHPDDGEFVAMEKVPLMELEDMIKRGDVRDAKTIIAVLMTVSKLHNN